MSSWPRRAAGDLRLKAAAGWQRVVRPGRARATTVAVLAVLALTLAALAAVAGWQVRERVAVVAAGAEGLAAAMRLTPALLSFDYRSLPADAERAEAATTGPFTTQVQALIDETIKPNAPAQQLVTKASAREGATVSAAADRVVALVFLSQVTTSKSLTAPRLDSSGVRVTLESVDGRWLIAGMERV